MILFLFLVFLFLVLPCLTTILPNQPIPNNKPKYVYKMGKNGCFYKSRVR